MKPEETKKILKLLAGLFPMQLTTDQGRLLAEQVGGLTYEAVEKAAKNHRASHDFLNFPKFIEGCRAAQHEAEASTNTSTKEGTWADVYRRQWPQLHGVSDAEVVLRVHRGWWMKVKDTESEGYRRQLHSSCATRLATIGFDWAQAESWAKTIFDPNPAYFQQVLDELRHGATAA